LKKIIVTPQARVDVRRIDRETAMRILTALDRLARTGEGDVKRLQDIEPPEFRLRVGDYRVRFYDQGDSILVLSVLHRSEAYR
jgi:mRNA interferase RelE/StbE